MKELIRNLCALCAMGVICEQAAGSGPFARSIRFLTGLQIAVALLRIMDEIRIAVFGFA